MDENDLSEIVENLDLLSEDYKNLAIGIMEPKSASINVDFIALSVINRAISINNAFKTLINEKNTYAALHLIRIQMDNLIRYYSILIAKDENYIDKVLEGQQINKFRDTNNEKFHDAFLAKKLSKVFPESKLLYDKYCGHIHFGKEHIDRIRILSENKDAKFRVVIGDFELYSFEERVTFVKEYIMISLYLYKILEDFIEAKKTSFL